MARGPMWWRASDGKWYPPSTDSGDLPPPPLSSDTQIAPDWWLASNGRWYPPADWSTRTTTGHYKGSNQTILRSSVPKALTAGVQAVLMGFGSLAAILALVSLYGRRGDQLAPHSSINDLAKILFLVGIVSVTAFISWSYLAAKATNFIARGRRYWTPGWAVGSWLIPVVNLLLPILVFLETEKVAGVIGVSKGTQRLKQQPTWIETSWLWWTLGIAGAPLTYFGMRILNDASGNSSTWLNGYLLVSLGSAALAVSNFLCVRSLSPIGRALEGHPMKSQVESATRRGFTR